MESYRPSDELLAACGFRRSKAANEWCHLHPVHMHYFEFEHALEVYIAIPHLRYNLTSQSDEEFRKEMQTLASAQPVE